MGNSLFERKTLQNLKVDEENLIKQLLEFDKKELEESTFNHYSYSDATEGKVPFQTSIMLGQTIKSEIL